VKKPKSNNAGAIIFPSWGKWCVKQSKLNTEHQWPEALTQWTDIAQNVIDQAVGQNSSFDKRKLILIILLTRCTSVVSWAVPQTAKVQQRTCHYCPMSAKQLGDLWNAAPTTLELRPDENLFAKFCCHGEVSDKWKSQSSTMHVQLLC